MRKKARDPGGPIRPNEEPPRGAELWRRYPWLPSYASCLFFAIMAVCIKMLTRSMPTGSIMFFRSAIPMLLFIPSLLWRHTTAAPGSGPSLVQSARRYRWSLIGRGVCGSFSLLCYLLAMRAIPASDVALTSNTSPLFAALAARLFLGEPLGQRTPAAFLCSFAGVALIVNGGSYAEPYGYAAGIASAALGGLAYSFIRRARELPPELIALAFTGIASLGAFPWAIRSPIEWTPQTAGLLLMMGLSGGLAQWLMTMGYQYNSVAVASTLGMAQVVCTAVLANIVLGESFTALQAAGAVLVLAGTWSLTRVPAAR